MKVLRCGGTKREKRKSGSGNKEGGWRAIEAREKSERKSRSSPTTAVWKCLRSVADVMAWWWWCWWFTAVRKSKGRTYYYHAAQLHRNFSPAAPPSAGLLIEADLEAPPHLEKKINKLKMLSGGDVLAPGGGAWGGMVQDDTGEWGG